MTRRTRPMRHARTPVSTGPSRRLTRRGVTVGAVIGLTLSALPAWAYWTSSASTSASAAATTLQPPATVTATSTGRTTTTVKVSAPPGTGATPTTYEITRNGSPICPPVPLNGSCTETGLLPNTTYTYSVVSKLQNWISGATSAVVTTQPVPAPSMPALFGNSITGDPNTGYTTDTSPTFSGTAVSGSSVRLYLNGSAVGSSTTATGGNWSITLSSGLVSTNRRHSLTARATIDGGTSADSDVLALLIDTRTPSNGTATSVCAVTLVNGFCPGQVTVSVSGATDQQNSDLTPGSGPSSLDYTVNGGTTTLSTAANTLSFNFNAVDGPSTSFTHRVNDAAGNAASAFVNGSTNIPVDRTAPSVTGINLRNGNAGTNNRADQGDSLSLTFSDVTSGINPRSFCSTWTINGASQTVAGATVTFSNSGSSGTSNDILTVSVAGACNGVFNFGSVALNANYVNVLTTFTNSSIGWVGPSGNTPGTLTVTLGSPSVAVNPSASSATPRYTPSTSITDLAGNSLPGTSIDGTNDRF